MSGERDERVVVPFGEFITGYAQSAGPVARQLRKALGIGPDEITAALETAGWRTAAVLSGEGSLTAGSGIAPGVSLSGRGSITVGGPAGIIRVAAWAGQVIVSGEGDAAGSLSVVRQTDVSEVSVQASRGALATLTMSQWLLVAVILIAAVYPFLPAKVKAELQGEATLIAALAAVLALIER